MAERGDFTLSEGQKVRVEALLANSEAIERFLVDCVEKAPGCYLLTEDLVEKCWDCCGEAGFEKAPERQLRSKLPELMQRLFGVSPSGSVGEFKNKRGFRGVGWRSEDDLG
jgi:hypothetical protein